MVDYKYNNSENVCHNSEPYTIFRKREVNGEPAYLLRNIVNGTVIDNILESQCMDCSCSEIINLFWPSFVYTGDNKEAAKWIMNNLIKKLHNCRNVRYGHNSDNTVYTFTCDDGTWTKNKTA